VDAVGATIQGTVTDGAGRPLAGARAFFSAGPGPFPDLAALTDADGRFELDAPQAGRYVVECHADGFSPAKVGLTLAAGESRTAAIALTRG
jgi:protocatechuate 3,4-dioxygenase beta subunit